MKAIFLSDIEKDIFYGVYKKEVIEELSTLCGIENKIHTGKDLKAGGEKFKSVEFIFSSWGMPNLTEEEIAKLLPNLKAVFYSAGSVQEFARPFLARGVKVFSAYSANAVPVSQYCLSQILLANAGYFQSAVLFKKGQTDKAYEISREFPGNLDVKVGLIGLGKIASLTADLLKPFNLDVYAYDPYVSEDYANKLGVKKADLDFIFSNCQTISNHLPENEETRDMLALAFFQKCRLRLFL